MAKVARLTLANIRSVFRLIGDVRDLRADPVAARKRIADGLCELLGGVHAFTLDLQGMLPNAELVATQMVIGGTPDEKKLAYLIESQKANHFRHIDPTTAWAAHHRAKLTAARHN